MPARRRPSPDGVVTSFRDQGFFLIRRAGQTVALSSICTHRQCKVSPEPDRSFYCDCHGSTFDPAGKVTHGPATRDLPLLETHVDARGHLLVTVPGASPRNRCGRGRGECWEGERNRIGTLPLLTYAIRANARLAAA